MATERFTQNIQQWVSIDNDMKLLQDKLKVLRQKKQEVETEIQHDVEVNHLEDTIIEITDGKLKFNTQKSSQPLTFKYVEECLHDKIPNDDHVKIILSHMKNKREPKYDKSIKRIYTK